MFLKKNIGIQLTFLSLVILLPFLDFLLYNIGNINERTDLRINFLTIRRLSFLYLIFIIFFFSLFFFIKKKINLDIFNLTIYLSFIYWIFFQYNVFKKIFNLEILSFFREFDGHLSLFTIFLFVFLFTIYFIKKKNYFINIFFVIFFSINFIFLSYNILNVKNFKSLNLDNSIEHENLNIKGIKKNNIYLIILDAMPPIEIADKILKTKSEDFIEKLEREGFNYISSSKSLYGNTFLTLASIFNLKPMDLKNEKDDATLDNLKYPNLIFPTFLREKNLSNLEFNLRKLDYEFKWIGSHFANCHGYNKKYCIKEIEPKDILFNYEILSFLKKTPFQPIMHNVLNILNLNIEEKVIFYSNNAIGHFVKYLNSNGKPEKPTFIFVHHLISHWPYLVDSECNYERNQGKTNLKGIKKAFECNKKLILDIVETISNVDKEAIVLVQSDHNWELSYENSEIYGKRRSIFNVIKLNNNCKNFKTNPTNNINAVRLGIFCATENQPILLNFDEN